MSNTGPPPLRKWNAGLACQRSMPCDSTAAKAASGLPMRPASIARRALWQAGPKTVSGATPTLSPFARAISMILRPSASVVESGVSL